MIFLQFILANWIWFVLVIISVYVFHNLNDRFWFEHGFWYGVSVLVSILMVIIGFGSASYLGMQFSNLLRGIT